jgi:hypothetical protein
MSQLCLGMSQRDTRKRLDAGSDKPNEAKPKQISYLAAFGSVALLDDGASKPADREGRSAVRSRVQA